MNISRPVDLIVVHCTATSERMDVGAEWVDQLHKRRGWSGCGYHDVIRRDGTSERADNGYPARPLAQAGAHVGGCGPGYNARSIGIALVGGVDTHGQPDDNFTHAQLRTLRTRLQAYRGVILREQGVEAEILGHRDLIRRTAASPKACPCFDVRAWFGSDRPVDATILAPDRPDRILAPFYHRVRRGQTMAGIARLHGVSLSTLVEINSHINDPDVLYAGDIVFLRG